jgi:hypothetical protein
VVGTRTALQVKNHARVYLKKNNNSHHHQATHLHSTSETTKQIHNNSNGNSLSNSSKKKSRLVGRKPRKKTFRPVQVLHIEPICNLAHSLSGTGKSVEVIVLQKEESNDPESLIDIDILGSDHENNNAHSVCGADL